MLGYKGLVRLNQTEVETSVQPLSTLYKTHYPPERGGVFSCHLVYLLFTLW